MRGRRGCGLTLAARASTSSRAIVFASQGCKVAFDIMFGGAAGGRLVEREAQMAPASVSMQFVS